MKPNLSALLLLLIGSCALPLSIVAQDLTFDELFPSDRVLDIQISVAEDDWDTIRYQSRDIRKELSEARKLGPAEAPYSYVPARASIDGVEFGEIGLRKKGFLGSQSTTRPSLKIKLDYVDTQASVGGLSVLTLNNNRQDRSLMCQFLGYALFNAAGSPAPRCAFARVTVNGKNLGIYSHVETCRPPLVKRGFGNETGTMYEGTVVDFCPGWAAGFEHKFGDDRRGREKIESLIGALTDNSGKTILTSDSFGRAWIPQSDTYDSNWTAVDFDDSGWKPGQNGAGYENQSGFQRLISDSFDFQEQLFNQSTSLCLRFPFEMDKPDLIADSDTLYLGVKYDDGFVAWLNGVRIASSNAPRELEWNSKSTGPQDDRAALQFERFDISEFKDLLKKDKNVLAIQALNTEKSSSDMLCVAEIRTSNHDFEKAIGQYVDLDAFYKFWAIEGLIGFWDGYSANRNNFFVYLNSETDKFHFVPWGADSLFVQYGYLQRDRREPLCVKSTGIVAHKLYQTPAGRARYAATMADLLENHWDEDALLAEVDRLEQLIRPHLPASRRQTMDLRGIRHFFRTRRDDVQREISEGLPVWTRVPGPPPVIRPDNDLRQRSRRRARDD